MPEVKFNIPDERGLNVGDEVRITIDYVTFGEDGLVYYLAIEKKEQL
jgi:hypothetical protein